MNSRKNSRSGFGMSSVRNRYSYARIRSSFRTSPTSRAMKLAGPSAATTSRASDEDPAVERGPVDRKSRKARDVEPTPIGDDALRPRHALDGPPRIRTKAVRCQAELAHALRALDGLPDDLLLLQDDRPKARGGELAGRHSPGGPCPHDRGVEQARLGRRPSLF